MQMLESHFTLVLQLNSALAEKMLMHEQISHANELSESIDKLEL